MNNAIVTNEEVRQIQLNMLNQLDKVCKDNRIQYFLSGGTMLGAIRHKGYIPWDDDIDVMMTLENYEKFISAWQDIGTTKIIYPQIADDYDIYFAKLYNAKTKLVSDNYANSEKMGVSIDVFPLYPLPEDAKKQKSYHKKASFYRSCLLNTNAVYRRITLKKANPLKKTAKYFYSLYCRIYGRKHWMKKLFCTLNKYRDEKTKGYTKPLTHINKNGYFPREWFDEVIETDFENGKYPVPGGYHEYLTQIFGDYSIEKKVPNHKNEFIWL